MFSAAEGEAGLLQPRLGESGALYADAAGAVLLFDAMGGNKYPSNGENH
jgi:hypothetical protein